MFIIFHSKCLNLLPFFCLELFIHDNKISCEEIFNKAWENYKSKSDSVGIFIGLKEIYPNIENMGIFLLIRGKKKKIVLQALDGYFSIFKLDVDYYLVDLSNYETFFYKYGVFFEKLGFEGIARYFNKKASEEIFEILQRDLKDIREKYFYSKQENK